jgi:hypothetical protein
LRCRSGTACRGGDGGGYLRPWRADTVSPPQTSDLPTCAALGGPVGRGGAQGRASAQGRVSDTARRTHVSCGYTGAPLATAHAQCPPRSPLDGSCGVDEGGERRCVEVDSGMRRRWVCAAYWMTRGLLSHLAGRHAAEVGMGVRLHTQGFEERGTPYVRDGCVCSARVADADSHTYGSQAEEAPMCIVGGCQSEAAPPQGRWRGRGGQKCVFIHRHICA